jgi:hypothetical protein
LLVFEQRSCIWGAKQKWAHEHADRLPVPTVIPRCSLVRGLLGARMRHRNSLYDGMPRGEVVT